MPSRDSCPRISDSSVFHEDATDLASIRRMASEAKRRLDHIIKNLESQSEDARAELAEALFDLGMRLSSKTFRRGTARSKRPAK
jgi:hypothetical protein